MMKEKIDLRSRVLTFGLSNPTNAELIALILGSGTKEYPVELLSKKVMEIIEQNTQPADTDAVARKLMGVPGIGRGKGLAVAAAVELGRRFSKPKSGVIRRPGELIPYVKKYADKKREYFIVVVLSGAAEVLSVDVISVGSRDRAKIDVREVFSQALKLQGRAVVLCHNHPSGNCFPSRDDINTTRSLSEAAQVLGISVLDHIIVTEGGYYSFAEKGDMEESRIF